MASGVWRVLQGVAGDMAAVLLPERCHLCGGKLLEGERMVCQPCLASLPRTLYHRTDMNPVEQRFAGFFRFERATSVYFYTPNSSIAALIQDFKYRSFPSLAGRLGEEMAGELMPTGFFADVDVILPVPMHWWKQARRGYNQVEHLARGISAVSGIPVGTQLRARRPHKTQTSLSHEERRRNTENLFAVKDAASLAGKHILLLDDVCTTGSTLRSAAEAVMAAVPTARLTLLTLCCTVQ